MQKCAEMPTCVCVCVFYSFQALNAQYNHTNRSSKPNYVPFCFLREHFSVFCCGHDAFLPCATGVFKLHGNVVIFRDNV